MKQCITSIKCKTIYSDFSSIAGVGGKIDSLILPTDHDNGFFTKVFTAQVDQLPLLWDVICSKFDRDFMIPSLNEKHNYNLKGYTFTNSFNININYVTIDIFYTYIFYNKFEIK